jgi:hypothetical protein
MTEERPSIVSGEKKKHKILVVANLSGKAFSFFVVDSDDPFVCASNPHLW